MRHVLIVDDEPDIANVLADLLGDEGFEVRVAHDGRQALDAMAKKKPELLITDLMMPQMNGHTLIREVRGSEVLRDLPILVMSAGTLDRNLVTPKTRFLPKPFELERMLEVISELLR